MAITHIEFDEYFHVQSEGQFLNIPLLIMKNASPRNFKNFSPLMPVNNFCLCDYLRGPVGYLREPEASSDSWPVRNHFWA